MEQGAARLLGAVEARAARLRIPCFRDPTLPLPKPGLRLLIANNLHNSEVLMPHFVTQMLRLLALLPRGSAFVSIYESGSKDRTGARPGVLRRLNPLPCLVQDVSGVLSTVPRAAALLKCSGLPLKCVEVQKRQGRPSVHAPDAFLSAAQIHGPSSCCGPLRTLAGRLSRPAAGREHASSMTRWDAVCAGAWLMLFDKLLDYMDIPHSIVIGVALLCRSSWPEVALQLRPSDG